MMDKCTHLGRTLNLLVSLPFRSLVTGVSNRSVFWLNHTRSWKWWKSWWEWGGWRRCWENSHMCLNQIPITCLPASYVFCSFVIMKPEVSFFKFSFYFIGAFWVFLQTSQAIMRTKQDSDEERAEMQNTLVLPGSDTAQVTSPVP